MTDPKTLTIVRIFQAPREKVWQAWTSPEQVKKWWGPKGFSTPEAKIDLRVGGQYLFCMCSPEGKDFWNTGFYQEIVPMEKIVCTDSFSNEKGEIVPASAYGMAENWPEVLKVTVTFEDEGAATKMTLRHEGLPEGEMKEATSGGWKELFDKLAASLS